MMGTMRDGVARSEDPAAKRKYWPAELSTRFAKPQFRGQGGMGRVWAAYDNAQRRQVAVKVLREDVGQYAESLERFQAEAARMQQVPPHPNVVEIYDYGTVGDWCFLTMPLLSGPHVSEKDLTVPDVLEVIQQTAAGLAHLHAHQLVHRDVKPRNLVFDGKLVKIVDFGIAKAIDVTPITMATAGTEGYMAPELRDPRNEVTTACDIYSLGCVLFALLTGYTLGSTPPPGRENDLDRAIPAALRPLLDAMVATDPTARPTAATVHDEVASFLAETSVQYPPTAAKPEHRPESRTRIVPLPEDPMPLPAHPTPAATAVAPAPVPPARLGPVQHFFRKWFTARGQFGRESLSPLAVVVAVGAWLLICFGGGWIVSVTLLLLLRLLGVG